ncbi:cytochrome P450 [Rhodocollybia butyracea]|uniref:Cytochrome P450 n=1 Tax=Rhodocollybia butyracea TaxID=206335 RepID=A0A9P5PED5_9AGAR|nr:cytochrome P450 [Rhodocollybia butyracea]
MIVNSYSLSVFVLGMSYLFWRHMQHRQSVVQKLPMPDSKIKAALFQPDIVIVGDNFAAHHILQNTYTTYGKPQGFLQLIKTLIGAGLRGIEGEDHKYQRRLLTPAFTAEAVKAMSDDISFCAERMTQNLSSSLIDTSGTIVDIVPVISACALDIIGRVGFGHNFEGGESKDAKAICSAWHQDVVTHTSLSRECSKKHHIYKIAGKLILDNSKHIGGNNILSILLNGNHKLVEQSEAVLTTTEILDNITTFLCGERVLVTSVTADFMLLQLTQTPLVQCKLQQEIRTAASLDYKSTGEFKYLSGVVKEGLRLHPVGQPTQCIARHDDVILLCTAIHTGSGEMVSSLAVKASQVLQIPWAILNVNKQVWGDNADKFIPEQWIEPGGVPPVDKLLRGPWNGVSLFSDGPQSCTGYRVALFSSVVVLF